MAEDALSDLLRTVRLTGAAFFEIAASDNWAVESLAPQSILPKVLARADHLISYHLVTLGRCYVTPAGRAPIALEAGQIIVLTHAQPHVVSSRPDLKAPPNPANVVEIATSGVIPFCINCGDEGPVSTRLVCGYLACDAGPFNPLLDHLPRVITAGEPGFEAGSLGQLVRFAAAETAHKRSGHESILTKLSELLFIDVVRRHIETLSADESGWLAGLRDPFVGKTLSLLHARPAHPWTLEELGKSVGQSRSMLAERFARMVGMPPMQYLARWRMQLAAELLSNGNMSLLDIAADVGYESDSSLSRAFKKATGMAPSAWRRASSRDDVSRTADAAQRKSVARMERSGMRV